MDDLGDTQEFDVDAHIAHDQQLSPTGQVTHQDLQQGIDIEEEDEDDSSGGSRRDGQEHAGPSPFGRSGP